RNYTTRHPSEGLCKLTFNQSQRFKLPLQRRRIRKMVPPDPQLFTSLNIIQPVIDKQTLPRRQIKAAQRKLVNLRIGLGQFLLSGNDNIGKIIENRLALTKMRPEFCGKIGYGEKADIRVMQALDQRGDAVNLTGVGFVKAGVKGRSEERRVGKEGRYRWWTE